jgi:hypothetical protein
MSTLDGERARVDNASGSLGRSQAVADAQTRALMTYFESVAVLAVLENWGTVPESVAASFGGVLSPIDDGFAALIQGALAFGVPEGFVPFVYAAGGEATNFEQMLELAQPAFDQQARSETSFQTFVRDYESNSTQIQTELASVRQTPDLRIQDACGGDFDPGQVQGEADWDRCGATAGEVYSLGLAIEQAQLRQGASQSRLYGMLQRAAVESDRLAQVLAERGATLRFVDAQGQELERLVWADTAVNAAQAMLQAQEQAVVPILGELKNGALGAAMAGLEIVRGAINDRRQELDTAQQMRVIEEGMAIEEINSAATIRDIQLDMMQLEIEMEQDSLAIIEAQVQRVNAIESTQRLWEERRRSIALVDDLAQKDPSTRLLRDRIALEVLRDRASAQRKLYLVGKAFEYEVNTSLPELPGAILACTSSGRIAKAVTCFENGFADARIAYGSPQSYPTNLSVRELLGIDGDRVDAVTGRTLSPGEQFRLELLKNANLDGNGGVGIAFATNLDPGNGVWMTDVCQDRVASLQAQLVGDFQGDDEAIVEIRLQGTSFLRSCGSDGIVPWSLGSDEDQSSRLAVVQAGVNDFGSAAANTSLFGQGVARATWQLTIPGGTVAPQNADLDLNQLDDIVLRIVHEAIPAAAGGMSMEDVSACLAGVAGG